MADGSPHTLIDTEERFEQVAPTTSYGGKFKRGTADMLSRKARKLFGSIPGFGGLKRKLDEPSLQVLSSESDFMAKWYKQDFGTPDKPNELQDMPWDYIEEHQEDIPFFGLREYWYPACESHELKHNEHKAVRLLGDNLVLFRTADGSPGALENRCPHRGALLTLGQVNVWEVGTITCRYHGMTFDKDGECVAFLADGPNSPTCGKIKAKSYPADEVGGIIWVYMGVKENPPSILDSMPHAREVLTDDTLIRNRMTVPYNYLNQLDNTVDMTHVGCLHRTCYLFGDQKMGGGVKFTELPGDGVHATLREEGGHGGTKAIDEIRWFMPNLVHHGEEFMEGGVHGIWFWFVPDDAGSFTAWMIGAIKSKKVGKTKARMMSKMLKEALQSDAMPGMACFIGGDAPMQLSQGRVVRWDQEQLTRTDRAVLKVRQMMKEAHKAEQEERRKRGLDPLAHRVSRQPVETS
ncbi:MAG: aromatic ring-hydroxylating dioxygenase subunit alpha [Henriciella sp.]|nr:aromatic ring-hydroxylating dioxygenase subunit alpha [Henriciella sp.]